MKNIKLKDFFVPIIYAIMLYVVVLIIAMWLAGCSININLTVPSEAVVADTAAVEWWY